MRKFCSMGVAAAAGLLLLSGAAQAQVRADPHAGHAGMATAPAPASGVQTTPADGWMGSTAPAAFSATFPHEMRLTALSLNTGEAQAVAITVPQAPASTTVTVPLPALDKGNHVITWSAEGADGHLMNGVVRFMVH